MQTLQEIVEGQAQHVYLVEGSRILGYQPNGRGSAQFFAHSMRFDRRGRKFVPVRTKIFDAHLHAPSSHLVEVNGSRGVRYWVDVSAGSCTCPGFQFRGHCKHLAQSRAA